MIISTSCLCEKGKDIVLAATTLQFNVTNEFGSALPTSLSDDHRALEPPDPIPNSDVKRCIADGSLGGPMRE